MIFCTLFDSHYLDKGLVMFESLKKVTDNFKLYVIAFDEKCYEVLSQIGDEKLIPIRLEDFESEELLAVKPHRTRGEYCWTCSSNAIGYILDNYEEECTYIDADMYFYSDPHIVNEEMKSAGCQVQIIEQRFDNRILSRQMMKRSGKYCVEFNTFTREKHSRSVLQWWQDRCIECCTVSADGKIFGDQKYLDDWTERFEGIHVVENVGAGVAPWNIANYQLVKADGDDIVVRHELTNQERGLVFYHFHNISYIDENTVNIEVYNRASATSKELVEVIYHPYLKRIEAMRRWLEKEYGLDYSIPEKHPTSVKVILQNFDIKALFGKLRGYSPVGLMQFLWYQKNRKQDVISLEKIR